jgi:replicative DNA helicase
VPKAAMDIKTKTILDDFGAYFKEYPECKKIDHDPFMFWFKGFRHPTLTEEQKALYDTLLRAVQEDVSADVEAGLRERLVAAATAERVAKLLQQWNDGDEMDLFVALREQVEIFAGETDRKVKVPWVRTPIGEMLEEEANDSGLHWRLDCLNMSMRPLRGGDFIVVAGRPDKGKTTFLTDNLTYMSKQVQDMYGGQRHVSWFNNEGPGKRIISRAYQSALNITIAEMVELYRKPSKTHMHLLDELYATAVGRLDGLRIYDVHDFWNHEVEDILREGESGLAVFDMVDNIKFGGEAANGGERTDQKLEAMYQWARMMAVKHDIPIIATSQISADGDGIAYPTLPMLKDSKTGKQGAAEAIITIGASNDPMLTNSRFIGSTKNKLHRSGGPKDPRCEVLFDGERGRYVTPRPA